MEEISNSEYLKKYQFIKVTPHDSYLMIALNRPEKRNAMHQEMRTELKSALSNVAFDQKCIVITGYGKAFCAGKDLNESSFEASAEDFMEVVESIYNCNAITIAVVNGAARGGGLMLVNACDIAIASNDATFGMPDLSSQGHTAFQDVRIQQILQNNAKGFLPLAGKKISATDAIEIGIVNEEVKSDQLLDKAQMICELVSLRDADQLLLLKDQVNGRKFENEIRMKRNVLTEYILGK